ncbi:hypothetical protein PINS_up011436 [Pythium insidiosum]|nr:hypothetical protein PINS_up011436 [Pythium insidiosum]
MRVKKLNVNRPKAKAGEDDADADAGADSTTATAEWGPPPSAGTNNGAGGKTYARSAAASELIDVGGDSPTDSSATLALQASNPAAGDVDNEYHHHQHQHQHQQLHRQSEMAPHAGSNSSPSWRDRIDRRTREAMHALIVDYLKTLKPNAPAKVLEKLPGLAYRMEETLLRLATSEAEYCDQSTLPQRLTLIQQTNAKRLLQQQSPAVSPKDKDGSSASQRLHGTRQPLNEEQARVVFSCLQSWRQKLVNMYGATPWEILPNQILAKVAVFIPSTLQELVICGVTNEQLERFGNSLLQEIQKVMNALNTNASATAQLQVATSNLSRAASPSGLKRTSPGNRGGKSASSSAAATKRGGSAASAGTGNKKRKTTSTAAASSSSSAPTAETATSAALPMAPADLSMAMASQGSLLPPNSFLSPSQLFMRTVTSSGIPTSAAAATSSGLPALLPSGPLPPALASAAAAVAAAAAAASASPAFNAQPQQQQQTPFFPRLQAQGQATHQDQDSRMHLLAQGAGQLSKQQHQQQQQQQGDVRSVEVYEKEIQTLRWLLQESQREKSQLEAEVARLREQLQAATSG